MYKNSELISHGIALVPIPFGRKGPILKGWNEKSKVVTSIADELLLKGLNIGIAHAYCTPSPTCAIDLDDCKASKQWLADKGLDLHALLNAPDAVVIHSGKSNSLKLLYRLPSKMLPMQSKAVKSPENRMMIEFRCASAEGLTVQDVLPPSVHPSGTQYKFVGAGSILALPMIPISLFDLWITLIGAGKRLKKSVAVKSTIPETPREIARLKAMLNHIAADCSYDTYRAVVWSTLSTGWLCAQQLAEEWSKTAPDRFDEINFKNVVNSYHSGLANPITLGTLTFLARKGGWNG